MRSFPCSSSVSTVTGLLERPSLRERKTGYHSTSWVAMRQHEKYLHLFYALIGGMAWLE